VDEKIKPIEIRSIRVPRKPSVVINNFFSLMTIIIISLVIIWYVNYVLPNQTLLKQKQLKLQQYHEYLKKEQLKRKKQIELSRKLHENKHNN